MNLLLDLNSFQHIPNLILFAFFILCCVAFLSLFSSYIPWFEKKIDFHDLVLKVVGCLQVLKLNGSKYSLQLLFYGNFVFGSVSILPSIFGKMTAQLMILMAYLRLVIDFLDKYNNGFCMSSLEVTPILVKIEAGFDFLLKKLNFRVFLPASDRLTVESLDLAFEYVVLAMIFPVIVSAPPIPLYYCFKSQFYFSL